MSAYPHAPGYKRPGTSHAAAASMRPHKPRLCDQCLQALREQGPMTADEMAEAIGATALATRPRVTELAALGKITDTGERRPNSSGRMACVWGLA